LTAKAHGHLSLDLIQAQKRPKETNRCAVLSHSIDPLFSIDCVVSDWPDMETESSHVRNWRAHEGPTGKRRVRATSQFPGHRREKMEDGTSQAVTKSGLLKAVEPHPLAELLDCPPEAGSLLNRAAQSVEFESGDLVFRQNDHCKGLYVVVTGLFLRKTDRFNTRVTLGPVRPGDLVELSAALGDGQHTYSLYAQSSGSLLILPLEALNQAFEAYPPLRMRLLEELAREVSRAYLSCCMNRNVPARRRATGPATA
jgi:hypothetical protein